MIFGSNDHTIDNKQDWIGLPSFIILAFGRAWKIDLWKTIPGNPLRLQSMIIMMNIGKLYRRV